MNKIYGLNLKMTDEIIWPNGRKQKSVLALVDEWGNIKYGRASVLAKIMYLRHTGRGITAEQMDFNVYNQDGEKIEFLETFKTQKQIKIKVEDHVWQKTKTSYILNLPNYINDEQYIPELAETIAKAINNPIIEAL